ncbi:MAG: hypothetical protein RLY20_648 [Verrucomicrobiota bacterium]
MVKAIDDQRLPVQQDILRGFILFVFECGGRFWLVPPKPIPVCHFCIGRVEGGDTTSVGTAAPRARHNVGVRASFKKAGRNQIREVCRNRWIKSAMSLSSILCDIIIPNDFVCPKCLWVNRITPPCCPLSNQPSSSAFRRSLSQSFWDASNSLQLPPTTQLRPEKEQDQKRKDTQCDENWAKWIGSFPVHLPV